MADAANEGWSGAVRGPIRGYRKPGSDSVPGTAGQAARVPTGLVSTSQNFPVLDSYFSVRGGPAAITGLETSRRRDGGADGRGRGASTRCGTGLGRARSAGRLHLRPRITRVYTSQYYRV